MSHEVLIRVRGTMNGRQVDLIFPVDCETREAADKKATTFRELKHDQYKYTARVRRKKDE